MGLTVWVARKAPMVAQREIARREHTTERRVAAIARRELDHHGAQLEGTRARLLEDADDPLPQYGRENPEHQTQNDLRDRESTLRNLLAEARASLTT